MGSYLRKFQASLFLINRNLMIVKNLDQYQKLGYHLLVKINLVQKKVMMDTKI